MTDQLSTEQRAALMRLSDDYAAWCDRRELDATVEPLSHLENIEKQLAVIRVRGIGRDAIPGLERMAARLRTFDSSMRALQRICAA